MLLGFEELTSVGRATELPAASPCTQPSAQPVQPAARGSKRPGGRQGRILLDDKTSAATRELPMHGVEAR